MSIDKSIENATAATKEMANGAPQWVATISIVALFVLYLYAEGQQELEASKINDHVASQRIENCHQVQEACIIAMEKMTEAMHQHDKLMSQLIIELETHRRNKN